MSPAFPVTGRLWQGSVPAHLRGWNVVSVGVGLSQTCWLCSVAPFILPTGSRRVCDPGVHVWSPAYCLLIWSQILQKYWLFPMDFYWLFLNPSCFDWTSTTSHAPDSASGVPDRLRSQLQAFLRSGVRRRCTESAHFHSIQLFDAWCVFSSVLFPGSFLIFCCTM